MRGRKGRGARRRRRRTALGRIRRDRSGMSRAGGTGNSRSKRKKKKKMASKKKVQEETTLKTDTPDSRLTSPFSKRARSTRLTLIRTRLLRTTARAAPSPFHTGQTGCGITCWISGWMS